MCFPANCKHALNTNPVQPVNQGGTCVFLVRNPKVAPPWRMRIVSVTDWADKARWRPPDPRWRSLRQARLADSGSHALTPVYVNNKDTSGEEDPWKISLKNTKSGAGEQCLLLLRCKAKALATNKYYLFADTGIASRVSKQASTTGPRACPGAVATSAVVEMSLMKTFKGTGCSNRHAQV